MKRVEGKRASLWGRLPRLGGRAGDGAGVDEPPAGDSLSLLDDFDMVKGRLLELGLFHDDSLLLLSGEGRRAVFNARGELVGSRVFTDVRAGFALLSHGTYSEQYARLGRPLLASTDDMAQMFGPRILCAARLGGTAVARVVEGRGFLVTGRYADELVAAAILFEKACRAELLAPKVGALHYLDPTLCVLEHRVYRASYTRREREVHHG